MCLGRQHTEETIFHYSHILIFIYPSHLSQHCFCVGEDTALLWLVGYFHAYFDFILFCIHALFGWVPSVATPSEDDSLSRCVHVFMIDTRIEVEC